MMGFHYRNADGTKAKCVGFKELKSCAEPSAPLSVLSEHIGSVIDMAWGLAAVSAAHDLSHNSVCYNWFYEMWSMCMNL